jgi:hypothetical protein
MEFMSGGTKWNLEANWRTLRDTNIGISFDMSSSAIKFEL